MKTVFIVYHKDWISRVDMESILSYLYHKCGIRPLAIRTVQPSAPDIRIWDFSTLTKIEFAEVKKLIEEYRKEVGGARNPA